MTNHTHQSDDSTQREAVAQEQLSVHTLSPVPADGQPDQPDYMPLFVAPASPSSATEYRRARRGRRATFDSSDG